MNNPSATLRTFLALASPAALHVPIRDLQSALQAALTRPTATQRGRAEELDPRLLRWTRPETMHLTLRFLGETDPAHVDTLAHTLQDALAGVAPFPLHVGGVGCFPQWRKPRVIWLGVGASEAWALARLATLQGEVEQAVRAVGYAPETRPFRPHFTMARTARNARTAQLGRLGEALAAVVAAAPHLSGPMGEPYLVREIIHFQSDLTRDGPVYTPLARIVLHG